MIEITVPMVPPSPNVTKRRAFNFHVYKDLRDKWERDIWLTTRIQDAKLLMKYASTHRMRVKITFYHSREFDPDNLPACQKPVLDALRRLAFIKDDSRKWIELEPAEQKKSARIDCRTVIEIEPILELETAA